MGLGIIESSRSAFPRGTTRVAVKETREESHELETTKRLGTIILSPQPSDDPNDPLNWSAKWTWVHLYILAFGTALANAGTTMLTPGLEPLTENIGSNSADVGTWILTAPTFWTSAAAFFCVAGSDIWGRRSFYFWSAVLLAASNFLSYASKTFPMLAVARTASGLFSAPLFTLVTASISDMFFVHQRGKAIAIWNLSLNGGAQIGQVLAGVVTDAFGVEANFLITAFMWTAMVPLVYFTIFESAYFKRDTEKVTTTSALSNKLVGEYNEVDMKLSILPPKRSYRQKLALCRGKLSEKSFFKGVIKPMGLLSHPIVVYNCFINAMLFVLLAGLSTMLSILLSSAPYNLPPTQIGLTNLPPFLVVLIASPLFGWMSDASVSFMARRNKGIAEPEFRLALLLLAIPITMVGLLCLGVAFNRDYPVLYILIWMTVTNVGAAGGIGIVIAYLIDCLPEHSAQAFTTINMVAAAVVTVGLTPMIVWLQVDGPLIVFGCLAAALALVSAFAIPFYVFGKKIRAWYESIRWARELLD